MMMPPVAALDVGTNTVQWVVATAAGGHRFEVLAEGACLTGLGRGLDAQGRLSPEAMERAVAAIGDFVQRARELGVTDLVACATSAARDASNRETFLAKVRERTGIALEIISGAEEARLCFLAVQGDFGDTPESPLVAVDVGGGSTEVVVGRSGGAATFSHSAQVGSVRLTERCVTGHPIAGKELEAMRRAAAQAFSSIPPAPGAEVVAVAATATSLYAVSAHLPSSTDPRVHGGRLTLQALEGTVAQLADLPLESRRQVVGLDPSRADVVCAGGIVLGEALRALGAASCRVSDRGLRWGILRDRFGR